jgi:Nucleotide-diphospho-sugar transferase
MLKKAATDDKIVILTEVNEAFAAPNSMLDLFLESFHNGDDIAHLLNHLIIVAMDQKAFEKCNSLHHHCYLHKHLGSDLSSEKTYLSKDYLDLVWSKVRLWQFILEQGYSFLFTVCSQFKISKLSIIRLMVGNLHWNLSHKFEQSLNWLDLLRTESEDMTN